MIKHLDQQITSLLLEPKKKLLPKGMVILETAFIVQRENGRFFIILNLWHWSNFDIKWPGKSESGEYDESSDADSVTEDGDEDEDEEGL